MKDSWPEMGYPRVVILNKKRVKSSVADDLPIAWELIDFPYGIIGVCLGYNTGKKIIQARNHWYRALKRHGYTAIKFQFIAGGRNGLCLLGSKEDF